MSLVRASLSAGQQSDLDELVAKKTAGLSSAKVTAATTLANNYAEAHAGSIDWASILAFIEALLPIILPLLGG